MSYVLDIYGGMGGYYMYPRLGVLIARHCGVGHQAFISQVSKNEVDMFSQGIDAMKVEKKKMNGIENCSSLQMHLNIIRCRLFRNEKPTLRI